MLLNNQPQHHKSASSHILKIASVMLSIGLMLTACGGQYQSQNDASVDDTNPQVSETETSSEDAADPKPTSDESDPVGPVSEQTEAVEDETTATDSTTEEIATDEADNAAAIPPSDGSLAADAGQKLYESNCKICHEAGVAGAPKFGDAEAWAPRIAKGKATLYKHSAEGFKAMPPQASSKVSVAQVHAAVDYMIEQAS